jgi:hypothetical protein
VGHVLVVMIETLYECYKLKMRNRYNDSSLSPIREEQRLATLLNRVLNDLRESYKIREERK